MAVRVNEVFYFFLGLAIQLTFIVILFLCYKKQLILNERYRNEKSLQKFQFYHHEEKYFYNESLSDLMFDEVKVLCMVMTNPNDDRKKAIYVKDTWGKRCNKLIFVSSQSDEQFDVLLYPFEETRSNLWNKTRWGFLHLYDNFIDEFDWFIKADDDSYVIVENLRYLLGQYNPKTAFVFGHRYAVPALEEGYMAGGGYILSKKALEKLEKNIVNGTNNCRADGEAEDWELANCLAHSAIFVDCRDEFQAKRFFPAGAEEHMRPMLDLNYWYTRYQYYHSPEASTRCCSDTSVQFHYIPTTEMMKLEYFIYYVHPFGLDDHTDEHLPEKKLLKEIISASDSQSPSKNFEPHKDYHNLESSEIY